ncbi:MAG: hypothetical protein VYE68_01625 [Acidobacteriota bacterium]|nr:hypothetical protein [Acidobacteriota bacterium]
MRRRVFETIGVLTVLMAVTALLKLAPVPLAGEGQTEPQRTPVARTPWGEPDLQGIWTTEFEIPLERPTQYIDQEFFSEEERAELDRERTRIINADQRRAGRGSEQDVGGAYNAAIFLSHKRLGQRTSLIVDPPDGRLPPLTPEAQSRRDAIREYQLALLPPTDVCRDELPACAGGTYGPPSPRRAEPPPYDPATGAAAGGSFNRSDGPEDRGLSERCMAARLPDFGGAAGYFLRIVQSAGTVSIFYDTGQGQGWQRVIPITDRPHLPPRVRQWWGDPRGHWEGNTLVVDTTNFSPKTDYQGSRENLHLVERWTRLDAETIEYVATMEDPTTWTQPWTVALELRQQSNEANRFYTEPRCHEGNYGLPGLLVGERTMERAFAEGQGPDPATLCTAGCGGFSAGFADSGADTNPLRR